MFKSIGWQELAIVLVIVLILFGPKRLPQIGKMFGKTVRNVRDGIEGKLEDDEPDELSAKSESAETETQAKAKSEDKTV